MSLIKVLLYIKYIIILIITHIHVLKYCNSHLFNKYTKITYLQV